MHWTLKSPSGNKYCVEEQDLKIWISHKPELELLVICSILMTVL